jgi:hypothetical protein
LQGDQSLRLDGLHHVAAAVVELAVNIRHDFAAGGVEYANNRIEQRDGGVRRLDLQDQILRVAVVNPRQIRDFARATARLAKTDTLDATVIVRGLGGERRILANEFFTGIYETALSPQELLAANRSRWHDARVEIMHRGCFGPQNRGEASEHKPQQRAGNSGQARGLVAEPLDHCHGDAFNV